MHVTILELRFGIKYAPTQKKNDYNSYKQILVYKYT